MRVSVVATGIDSAAKSIPQPTMLDMTNPMSRVQTISGNHKETPTRSHSSDASDDAMGVAIAKVNTDSPLARLVREAQATNTNVDGGEQTSAESRSGNVSDQTTEYPLKVLSTCSG